MGGSAFSEKIRAGVIGVGHLGQHHARLYASIPGVTSSESRIRALSAGKKSPDVMQPSFYCSPEELLKAVDLVSVAVPPPLTYNLTDRPFFTPANNHNVCGSCFHE